MYANVLSGRSPQIVPALALVHKPSKYFFREYFRAPHCRKALPGNTLAWLFSARVRCFRCPFKLYSILVTLNIKPDDTKPASIIRRFDCGWQIDPDVGRAGRILETRGGESWTLSARLRDRNEKRNKKRLKNEPSPMSGHY